MKFGHGVGFALLVLSMAGCGPLSRDERAEQARSDGDELTQARERMVREQLEARGITNDAVLDAMRRVPRHRFVPSLLEGRAYGDHPLPIGLGQTISQPYIVAYMTELAAPSRGARVLEVGTGSGYQAAVLAELGAEVYSIEILPELAEGAREALRATGYDEVRVRTGDGYAGWPEAAPFDAILVTAAPDHVPPALVAQLAEDGRLVIPVGTGVQQMMVIRRTADGVIEQRTIPVRFVPLVREPR